MIKIVYKWLTLLLAFIVLGSVGCSAPHTFSDKYEIETQIIESDTANSADDASNSHADSLTTSDNSSNASSAEKNSSVESSIDVTEEKTYILPPIGSISFTHYYENEIEMGVYEKRTQMSQDQFLLFNETLQNATLTLLEGPLGVGFNEAIYADNDNGESVTICFCGEEFAVIGYSSSQCPSPLFYTTDRELLESLLTILE